MNHETIIQVDRTNLDSCKLCGKYELKVFVILEITLGKNVIHFDCLRL